MRKPSASLTETNPGIRFPCLGRVIHLLVTTAPALGTPSLPRNPRTFTRGQKGVGVPRISTRESGGCARDCFDGGKAQINDVLIQRTSGQVSA